MCSLRSTTLPRATHRVSPAQRRTVRVAQATADRRRARVVRRAAPPTLACRCRTRRPKWSLSTWLAPVLASARRATRRSIAPRAGVARRFTSSRTARRAMCLPKAWRARRQSSVSAPRSRRRRSQPCSPRRLPRSRRHRPTPPDVLLRVCRVDRRRAGRRVSASWATLVGEHRLPPRHCCNSSSRRHQPPPHLWSRRQLQREDHECLPSLCQRSLRRRRLRHLSRRRRLWQLWLQRLLLRWRR